MSGDGERRAGSRTPQIRNEGRAATATLEVQKKEDVDEVFENFSNSKKTIKYVNLPEHESGVQGESGALLERSP